MKEDIQCKYLMSAVLFCSVLVAELVATIIRNSSFVALWCSFLTCNRGFFLDAGLKLPCDCESGDNML